MARHGGRQKGTPNKTTAQAREAIALFVDNNVDQLNEWLAQIAKIDPKDAFNCFMSVLEYNIPKLARTELQPLDKDGNKSDGITKIIIERVAADGNAK